MEGEMGVRDLLNAARFAELRAAAAPVHTVACSIFTYFAANLWVLIPLAAVALVGVTLLKVTQIANDEQLLREPYGNWLLMKHGDGQYAALIGEMYCAPKACPAAAGKDKAAVNPQDGHKAAVHILRDNTVLGAREAKARLAWAMAVGILFCAALAVLFAASIYFTAGFLAHRDAMKALPLTSETDVQPGGLEKLPRMEVSYLYPLVGSLLLFLFLTFCGAIAAMDYLSGSLRGLSSLTDILKIVVHQPFNDAAMQWLAKTAVSFNAYLKVCGGLVLLALLMVALLVSTTLLQTPKPDTVPDKAYLRGLEQSFGRLKVAIYLGAGLLVATVAEVSTQFGWALSFLGDATGSEAAKKALGDYGDLVSSNIGIGFTLLLAALYFPAIVILRYRGRTRYWQGRTDGDLQGESNFLAQHGLSINISHAYVQFLALLAPAAAGAFGHFSALFGG
jgi:hypothetical protein